MTGPYNNNTMIVSVLAVGPVGVYSGYCLRLVDYGVAVTTSFNPFGSFALASSQRGFILVSTEVPPTYFHQDWRFRWPVCYAPRKRHIDAGPRFRARRLSQIQSCGLSLYRCQ